MTHSHRRPLWKVWLHAWQDRKRTVTWTRRAINGRLLLSHNWRLIGLGGSIR